MSPCLIKEHVMKEYGKEVVYS